MKLIMTVMIIATLVSCQEQEHQESYLTYSASSTYNCSDMTVGDINLALMTCNSSETIAELSNCQETLDELTLDYEVAAGCNAEREGEEIIIDLSYIEELKRNFKEVVPRDQVRSGHCGSDFIRDLINLSPNLEPADDLSWLDSVLERYKILDEFLTKYPVVNCSRQYDNSGQRHTNKEIRELHETLEKILEDSGININEI